MQRRNKLAPKGLSGKFGNFLLNLFWAIVWLGRWCMRIIGRYLGR